MHNNISEPNLRRQAIGRRNWLFVGSEEGGHAGFRDVWASARVVATRALAHTSPGSAEVGRPETEVVEKARRRRFTAEYKSRIVREAERCEKNGGIGALLRREGLYSSLLCKWRHEAAQGGLAGLQAKKRGPAPKVVDERDRRITQLEKQLSKVERRAKRAEALVELQKKVADLLGIILPENDETK